MSGSPKKKRAVPRDTRGATSAARATIQQVGDLAWAGQHAKAIEVATASLARSGLSFGRQIDLLDLRSESFIAQGDLGPAEADAKTMLELARRARKPAFIAQALNRRAIVEFRAGKAKAATVTADEALHAARQSKQVALEALSLFRLAEAQFRALNSERSAKTAAQAARLFKSLGDPVGEGRALWAIAAARSNQARVAETMDAANQALAIARRCGDLYGAGNAINILSFNEPDIATSIRLLLQSQAAFEAVGYVERNGVVTHNLGLAYSNLGLYRRARRLLLSASAVYRRTGASGADSLTVWLLALAEFEMGHLVAARAYMKEALAMAEARRDERNPAFPGIILGRLAWWDGDATAAVRHLAGASQLLRDSDQDGLEMATLSWLARARMAAGDPTAALEATKRATTMHKAHELAEIEAMDSRMLWWEHSQALAANGKKVAARQALATAYRLLVRPIAGMSDEGLRRNYLNKIDVHRRIVAAWLKEVGKRGYASTRRAPHLAGKTSLREPFERLVDTGLRLNELRSAEELHEFLIDEATELSGAERVLLVLETPQGPHLAGSLVPKGEDAQALLVEIAPALTEVRRARVVSLAFSPGKGDEPKQRSHIIAPLIAQKELLGYLYADIDGAFGRFHDADRDLLGMLASQAAVALDNARWSQGLEQKVTQRTEELRTSNDLLAERANELEIINSVQGGLAAQLDFQAIIDLVGDKIRGIFRVPNISIALIDRSRNQVAMPYYVEHNERFPVQPFPLGVGLTGHVLATRVPLVINENFQKRATEYGTMSIGDLSDTDTGKSYLGVPILSGDEALGVIALYGHDENEFDEPSVNLLITLASSMSVALQNARLFDETQRLLKETERRAAELSVINSIQQGVAAELDFQAIVDLVGDKLREVLGTEDIGIRLVDPDSGMVHYLYEYEHGRRLRMAPAMPKPGGPGDTMRKTGKPVIFNTAAELDASGIGVVPGTDRARSVILVPIVSGERMTGSLLLENHEREFAFGEAEVRLLTTVASSMGVALENARLFDETQRLLKESEQRAAELAVINSIQQGLVAQLDLMAIIDLVGDKLREVFDSGNVSIAWFDEKTWVVTPVYSYEHGRRLTDVPPGEISRSERNLRVVQERVAVSQKAMPAGAAPYPGTSMSKSDVRAPVVAAGRVIALVSLDNFERENAFSDDDVRLLTTVCTAMGMALQSARLFDETQRLLKETEQRNAELAVINSIQQGMAAKLDFQAIIDLVGDKMREVFGTGDIGIRWYDADANLIHFLYEFEHGVRLNHAPRPPLPGGPWEKITVTRQPMVIHDRREAAALGVGPIDGTDNSHSSVFVPIVGSDRALGLIVMEDYERENAFGEAEVRLISTVAASMGVALENARLFDETQRLFKESDQRAAELAIINSVQQALAAELNMQGIYDAVGDKIREIFHQSDMDIRIYDPLTGLIHYPYTYEHGKRIDIPSNTLGKTGFAAHVLRTRETLVLNEDMAGHVQRFGSSVLPGTTMEKSAVYVPLVAGDQARGLITLINVDHEHAFGESDVRLLQTLANAMSVALENARLFDETQRRTREAAALAEVGRDISSTLDLATVMDRIARHAKELLNADTGAIFLPEPEQGASIAPSSPWATSRKISCPMPSSPGWASSAASSNPVAPSSSTTPEMIRAPSRSPVPSAPKTSA